MKVSSFLTLPIKSNQHLDVRKVSFIDNDGKNISFTVTFCMNCVSSNFQNDTNDLFIKKIAELIEKNDTFFSNYELEILEKDFH